MAVRDPIAFSLFPSASSSSFQLESSYSTPLEMPEMASSDPNTSTPNRTGDLSQSAVADPALPHSQESSSSKITSKTHTDSPTHDEQHQGASGQDSRPADQTKHDNSPPARSGPLKIDTEKSTSYAPPSINEDEPPTSVIHAPVGFGRFNQAQPPQTPSTEELSNSQSSSSPSKMTATTSSTSTDSVATVITMTRLVGDDTEAYEKPTQIPPLQTQIPTAQDWTRTPRAQTRRDLGMSSRPGSSVASLSSISEAEDDHLDQSTTDISADEADENDKPVFYRDDEEDIRALQTALTECWTLCNTLAGLSYVHREKIFSKKGNTQQQAWRSCWRLCENLYEARNENISIDVRPTLDLCREFCQALFDVRAKDDEASDSVLRVSFELNNHLFNTHDRSLPEAFSERTLDFYITLCHRLMKQRSSLAEETNSLLRACWSLAEMLFTIRQTRREGRKPDEELLSSAVQACWELCDLFREGWTQIRPDRQTPRPAHTTLTQAFEQAKRTNLPAPRETPPRFHPETPTTIFEDLVAESPYEVNAPNIVVFGPGQTAPPLSATTVNTSSPSNLQPRLSSYRWPTTAASSTVTSITSNSNSPGGSIQTVRSPSEDPSMVLLKVLFVRAALRMNRGFSPLASTSITTVSSLTSLPLFVKSLPEIAFGPQAWQMSLLDNYRKAIANDPTFRTLGPAANPTLLGVDTDEAVDLQIGSDTARVVQTVVNGTFGWSWLKDLYRYTFGVHMEDVLSVDKK